MMYQDRRFEWNEVLRMEFRAREWLKAAWARYDDECRRNKRVRFGPCVCWRRGSRLSVARPLLGGGWEYYASGGGLGPTRYKTCEIEIADLVVNALGDGLDVRFGY